MRTTIGIILILGGCGGALVGLFTVGPLVFIPVMAVCALFAITGAILVAKS